MHALVYVHVHTYVCMCTDVCMHACVCAYAYMRTGVPSCCAALAALCNQVVRCVAGCPVMHPDKTYPKLYTPGCSAVAPFHLAGAGRFDDVQHACLSEVCTLSPLSLLWEVKEKCCHPLRLFAANKQSKGSCY